MFSVAALLDRAKARAGIESDYRLAKVIAVTHSTMSGYRGGRTMPDERVLEQLCALSGDDLDVIAAQVQAERARTAEGKALWLRMAARLQAGAATLGSAIFAVVLAMLFVAGTPGTARAAERHPAFNSLVANIYIVSSAIRVRLRRWATLLPLWWRLFHMPGI